MNITKVFAAAAIVASFNLNGAGAQSLSDGLVPSEFPPASFQGRQYVDSRGCVFIRAGVDGNVTWIPRVTRSRKLICGFQPTFGATAPKVAVRAKPAPEPVAEMKVQKPVVPKKKTATATKAKAQPVTRAAKTTRPAVQYIVPRHVYENQLMTARDIGIPEGYQPAWDDDRLNPRRAHQTLAGKAQMDRVWTADGPA